MNKKTKLIIVATFVAAIFAFIISILIGKYPVTLVNLKNGDSMTLKVFFNLRLPRSLMGLIGGFGIGLSGYVYQTIFKNPLASPDIVGVSSGASVGAAFGILFISSAAFPVTIFSFIGGLLAILLTLILTKLVKNDGGTTIVLAGIAVHALAQTLLMILKLTADPEKQLASIEYWIMGDLSGITMSKIPFTAIIVILGFIIIILLHRQLLMLSVDYEEAHMLGVPVSTLRMIILIIATLMVASVISSTGLISFIGLLAPHIARLEMHDNNKYSMILSGINGSLLLICADIFAKSIAQTELPVSIFTSLLGVPFFIYLLIKRKREF